MGHVVSISRRTDVVGWYRPWLIGRLEAGSCRVANPMNPRQVREVSLFAEEVDALVFWTRAPGRLAELAPRLAALGHERVVAMVTITGYGRELEPKVPGLDAALRGFRELSARIGPERLRWRYDPIVVGGELDAAWHRRRFARIASALEGATSEVLVSFLDLYRKTERRLAKARPGGFPVERLGEAGSAGEAESALLSALVAIAGERGMRLSTCAEPLDWSTAGSTPGRCIDPAWLGRLWPGRHYAERKDQGQRAACGCMPSVDIGAPDSCLYGCAYCYATRSDDAARARHARHDPSGAFLAAPAASNTPRGGRA